MAFSEQELIRRESLKKLRDSGINPYPAPQFHITTYSSDIISNFEEGKEVTVAGRLVRRKIQGKA